jgi:hypothetical protein
MACSAISAVTYTCLQNTGGVKNIYITNFENVTGTTANGIGTLTDIDLSGSAKFQQFQFNRNTSSIEEEATINLENGTTFYTQTVNLVIPRRQAATRDKILVLASGQPKLAVIVEDQNGLFWFVGLENGAYLTSNKTGSGVKKDDANAYTLTLVGEEPDLAPEVDSSVISGITA